MVRPMCHALAYSVILLGLLLSGAARAVEGAQTPSHAVTPPDLIEMHNLTGVSLSPRGDFVAVRVDQARLDSNTEEMSWYVVPTKGGPSLRVGSAGEPNWTFMGVARNSLDPLWYKAQWSPDERWILYLALHNGQVQLWRGRRDGMAEERLTDAPADIERFAVAEDGVRIFFVVGATRQAIQAAEEASLAQGTVFRPSGFSMFGVGRTIPINGRLSVGRFDPRKSDMVTLLDDAPRTVWVLDLKTRRSYPAGRKEQAEFARLDAPTALVGHPDALSVKPSPNAGRVAWLDPDRPAGASVSDQPAPVSYQLAWTDAAGSGATTCPAPECTGRIRELWWSADGRQIYFWRDEGLNFRALYAVDPVHSSVRTILRTDEFLTGRGSEYERWAPCPIAGDLAICITERTARPPRLEALDLRSRDRKLLLDPNPQLGSSRLSETRRLDITDRYGDRSFGYLVMPLNPDVGGPYPLIITTYRCPGFARGAGGNEQPVHAFAAQGFAVLCFDRPNQADSTSAGSAGIEFRDTNMVLASLEAAIDELIAQGIVDPKRIGLTGLSNGAQNTVFAISHSPRFAAASIAADGVDPILYDLDGGGESFKPFERLFGLPRLSEPGAMQAWQKFSAALTADQIHAPLLMQSAQLEQPGAMELYTRLSDLKKPVEAIVYADEFHQKYQPRHRLAVYERNLDWFNFWLRGIEDPDPAKTAQYERWHVLRGQHEAELEREERPAGAAAATIDPTISTH
jgi:dipeptidyl aminopeptidase/acylaminoacyl peptidase